MSFLKKKSFPLLALGLGIVACSPTHAPNKPEGISVGNAGAGMTTYVSPYQFRIRYDAKLERVVEPLETKVTISDEKLVGKTGRPSRLQIEIVRRGSDYPGFAAKTAATGRHLDGLKALLDRKYPGAERTRLDLPGAHGFLVEPKSGLGPKYFLLNGNLDLVILSPEIESGGRGAELIAPIVETFAGDSEPPLVTAVRFEASALRAPAEGRLIFKALDPSGISLDISPGGVEIELAGATDGRGQLPADPRLVPIGDDEYALGFRAPRFAARGEYRLKKLTVSDKAGNPQSLSGAPTASFLLENPDEDVVGPTFGRVVLDDPRVDKSGDSLSLELHLQDDRSGISTERGSCVMVAKRGAPDEKICGPLAADSSRGTDAYRLTVPTGPNWRRGAYSIARVIVWDQAGNPGAFVFPAPAPMVAAARVAPAAAPRVMTAVAPRPAPEALAFELRQNGDVASPVIWSAAFSPAESGPGATVELEVSATDSGRGIATAEVAIEIVGADPADQLPDLNLRAKLESSGGDRYRVLLTISEWQPSGKYALKSIGVRDEAGNPAVWDDEDAEVFLMVK